MCKTVLVIDDDWTIQQALRARLSAHGYGVVLTSDGPSGLAAAKAHCPDAVLLDLRMPDMDGFEVLRQLRAIPCVASVPVIFLTANVHDTVRERARAAGVAGFLTKPYEARTILELIGEVAGVES